MKTFKELSLEYSQKARLEKDPVIAGELHEKANRWYDLTKQDNFDLSDFKVEPEYDGSVLLTLYNEVLAYLPIALADQYRGKIYPVIDHNGKSVVHFPFGNLDISDLLADLKK